MSEKPTRATREELAAAFGAALRRRRKAGNITQEALAEAADITPTYVSMLERGEHPPSLHTAFGLAAGLGVKVADLIEDTNEELRTRSRG